MIVTDGNPSSTVPWRNKPLSAITVDIVVPVYNEAHVLAQSIFALQRSLEACLPYRWRIVIAENASTDDTLKVAERLCGANAQLQLVALDVAGRGRALRAAWTASDADIVSYTDVDLSTEPEALRALCDALVGGGADVAIASRLLPGSKTTRSFRRQFISRTYNWLLRQALSVPFSDAQTGCKALTREVVNSVLPLVENETWFFDSELLVLADRIGFRIADIPVAWKEDPDSRVKILATVWEDLDGIVRMRRRLRQPECKALLAERRERIARRRTGA